MNFRVLDKNIMKKLIMYRLILQMIKFSNTKTKENNILTVCQKSDWLNKVLLI